MFKPEDISKAGRNCVNCSHMKVKPKSSGFGLRVFASCEKDNVSHGRNGWKMDSNSDRVPIKWEEAKHCSQFDSMEE